MNFKQLKKIEEKSVPVAICRLKWPQPKKQSLPEFGYAWVYKRRINVKSTFQM